MRNIYLETLFLCLYSLLVRLVCSVVFKPQKVFNCFDARNGPFSE